MAQPILLFPSGAPDARGATSEDRPTLTPCLLDGPETRACVIVLPGGGYARRADHEGVPVAQWLNSLGLHSAVLDYRVAPYRHPAPLSDAQRAIRLVRAHAAEWKIDPKRIGILGFSAGGHLAASAATLFDRRAYEAVDAIDEHTARPDAAILCYPVISSGPNAHQGSFENLLGPDAPAELRREMSLENQVNAQTPPCFIWHTANDGAVPVENALLFASALSRAKVPYALHVFPDGPHGVGLASDRPALAIWTKLCANWLTEIGFRVP